MLYFSFNRKNAESEIIAYEKKVSLMIPFRFIC